MPPSAGAPPLTTGEATTPATTGGGQACATSVFARNTAGSSASRIPILRIQGRIGAERWRWYSERSDRQAAYSRMHIAVNRKLAQMACVSNCHSIVLYFPESMQTATWSSFGSFDAGLELYDAIEEHMERETAVVDVDFSTLWNNHVTDSADGFPVLDRATEALRGLGVGEIALRNLGMSFRAHAIRHLRGENSMRADLARYLEIAMDSYCRDLAAGTTAQEETPAAPAPVAAPAAADGDDDEVMDLTAGSPSAEAPPPQRPPPPPRASTTRPSTQPPPPAAAPQHMNDAMLAMLTSQRTAAAQAQQVAHALRAFTAHSAQHAQLLASATAAPPRQQQEGRGGGGAIQDEEKG